MARSLEALREGELTCPGCGLPSAEIFSSEDGPVLEILEGPVPETPDAAAWMSHAFHCPREGRDFRVAYRPREPLPACLACESDVDVIPESAPLRHFALTAHFEVDLVCAACDEFVGRCIYEAFDVRDGGVIAD